MHDLKLKVRPLPEVSPAAAANPLLFLGTLALDHGARRWVAYA